MGQRVFLPSRRIDRTSTVSQKRNNLGQAIRSSHYSIIKLLEKFIYRKIHAPQPETKKDEKSHQTQRFLNFMIYIIEKCESELKIIYFSRPASFSQIISRNTEQIR